MGKKSKNPQKYNNPDGSKTLMMIGEELLLGGRTAFLANAGCPEGTKEISLDFVNLKHNPTPYSFGERQIRSIRGMKRAFQHWKEQDMSNNRDEDELSTSGGSRERNKKNPHAMSEAAIHLELQHTLADAATKARHARRQFTPEDLNKFMIMSTHRWLITILPISVVRQVAGVVEHLRSITKTNESIVNMKIDDPYYLFKEIVDATEQNRPEIIYLMNELFQIPHGVNVFVYSEKDGEIEKTMSEFSRCAEADALIELDQDASSTEILEYIKDKAGVMDSACCYWCEKNKLSTKTLYLCTRCKSVSYCGKTCQALDWAAFHRHECKKISDQGQSKKDLGMSICRLKTLSSAPTSPKIPFLIAPLEDHDHVFRGDYIYAFIMHFDKKTGVITEKTKMLPYGLQFVPRECGDIRGEWAGK